MKRLLIFPLFLILAVFLTAAIPPVKSKKVSIEPSAEATITFKELLDLSPKQYTELTGEKLNFKEKLAFSFMKKKLRNDESLNLDEKVNVQQTAADASGGFNIVGFIVGLLFGIIGVALVHIFSRDKAARRSSWMGFGVLLIAALVLVSI
ncbi:MAG: hypothetical protein V4721_03205 [Bacteroidota bacterium]